MHTSEFHLKFKRLTQLLGPLLKEGKESKQRHKNISSFKERLMASKAEKAMGRFHRAGTGKNKKVIEISPLPAFWPERAKE